MFKRILAAAMLIAAPLAVTSSHVSAATGCSGWTSNPGYIPGHGYENRTGNAQCADLQQGNPGIGTPSEWLQVWIICNPVTQTKIYGPQVFNDNQVSSATCPAGQYVISFGPATGFTS